MAADDAADRSAWERRRFLVVVDIREAPVAVTVLPISLVRETVAQLRPLLKLGDRDCRRYSVARISKPSPASSDDGSEITSVTLEPGGPR